MISPTGDDNRNDCVSVCRSFCADTICVKPNPFIYPILNSGQALLFSIRHLLQMVSQCSDLLFVRISLPLILSLLAITHHSPPFPLLNHLLHLSGRFALLLRQLLP